MAGARWWPRFGRGAPPTLTDSAVVAAAVAVWVGATWARPVPILASAVVLGVAVARRRPLMLIGAAGALASGLGAAAWTAVTPVPDQPIAARVRLVSDPEPRAGAQVVLAALPDGRRVELWARGGPAGTVRPRQAGETVAVTGRLEARPEGADWLTRRHVSNRLMVESATDPGPAAPPWSWANGVRHLLVRGSVGLPYEQRALFAGFVLGDDRDQDPATLDAFRSAGLTHLLVVSGQNVAFLLAVARPGLARLGVRSRLVATVALLGLFAVVTRFEPSVLRATVMAAVAVTAATAGRPVATTRVLALAVIALVLADPLLAGSIGFELSVAATAGIVGLAPSIEAALRGPRWVTQPLAVTLAAQAGVAPVLVPAFGAMPLAAIPANLLAVPVAGAVMMWGTAAGVVAGAASSVGVHGVARVLHGPTRIGLAWITGVADRASALPVLSSATVGLPVVAGAVAALVIARPGGRLGWSGGRIGRWPERNRRWVALAAALAVGFGVAAVPVASPGGSAERWPVGVEVFGAPVEPGVVEVMAVDGRADADRVLRSARSREVRRVRTVVARSGAEPVRRVVEALRRRVTVDRVLAAPAAAVDGATIVDTGGVRLALSGPPNAGPAVAPGTDEMTAMSGTDEMTAMSGTAAMSGTTELAGNDEVVEVARVLDDPARLTVARAERPPGSAGPEPGVNRSGLDPPGSSPRPDR